MSSRTLSVTINNVSLSSLLKQHNLYLAGPFKVGRVDRLISRLLECYIWSKGYTIGEHPLDHHKVYREAWDATVNRFTLEFIQDFCLPDGAIDWDKLVQFNSGKESIKLPRKPVVRKRKKNGR